MNPRPEPSVPPVALTQTVPSGSGPSELAAIVEEYDCARTLATGGTAGESASAITAVHERRGHGLHLIIEPDQENVPAPEGLSVLGGGGASRLVRLIAKSPDLALPELLSTGTELDFALIAGEKDFEQAFLEFVYLDRMLMIGGILVLENRQGGPAVAVAQYVAQARAYEPRSAPDSPLLVLRKLGRQRVTARLLPSQWQPAASGTGTQRVSGSRPAGERGDEPSRPLVDVLAPTDNRELYLAQSRAGHLETVNRQLRSRLMEAELEASRELDDLRAQITLAHAAHQRAEHWLAEIKGSPSWRLTAPLRFLKRCARRLLHR